MTLYMIGMVRNEFAFSMLGVAENEEIAKVFVEEYLQEHAKYPPEPGEGELEWGMTSNDNFESLIHMTSWEDMDFVIKTTTLLTKENT